MSHLLLRELFRALVGALSVFTLFALMALTGAAFARAETAAQTFEPGDVVALSLPCWACDLIEKTTRSPYSHVVVVDRDAEGKLVAWMAAEPSVMKVDLAFLLSKARKPVRHLRLAPAYRSRAMIARALERIRAYEGTPYDARYESGDAKLYCSELIHFAFRREGESLFPLSPMDFEPYREEWRTALGHEPPQGELGISPAAIASSRRLVVVTSRRLVPVR